MNYHDRLSDKERIRIHAQTKHEQLKAEAIDILIDAVHRQMCGGATVSFDHNLALMFAVKRESAVERRLVRDSRGQKEAWLRKAGSGARDDG